MKTLIRLLPAVLSLVLLSSELGLAGAPPLQWQKTFGGSTWDGGGSVQQTTDGGYIITGWTRSFGAGEEDVYLIKTDPDGNSQWQKTFGGSDIDMGSSVQQTSDGGYIISGYTLSYGAGSCDVYLIKTDPNGYSQWQKTFGGSTCDSGGSVQQTTDGGYIIVGCAWSYGAGACDVYLIKTDPNGNSQWQKTFGGSELEYGRSVQQTSDGGYIIAGDTESYGAGLFDVYLIKTDPNGNSQWQKTFGASDDDDHGRSVQQTSDGGYIIAGDTGFFFAPYWGWSDVYLIKTDPDGNSQWQKTFSGSNSEWGADWGGPVQQTFDGGYIITGTYDWVPHWASPSDVYLIKTDPNGDMQWQKTFGGSLYEDGGSVQQTSDSGYIIVGSTYSYGAGEYDVYLIKLCSDGTLSADLNCNGTVHLEDLSILADQWLQLPGILSADMAPPPGDGTVNFLDFAAFAQDWLKTTTP